MLDEVQCGMGRTGKWFAHQWAGIVPDVMPLAKGLGSGVPVGAIVVGPRAEDVFGPGNHGTTFGGNPLAMRAGVETLRIIEEDRLLDNAARGGRAHQERAAARAGPASTGVVEIRGQGLMIGIELDRPCGELLRRAADAGLLISVTADSVIRLLPPLIMTPAEGDAGGRASWRRWCASSWPPRHEAGRPPDEALPAVQGPARRGVRLPVRAHRASSRRASRTTSATSRWSTARWR